MGQAATKRKTGLAKLPRRFWMLVFNDRHPLAGQVVRVTREAACYFTHDEARMRQGFLEHERRIPEGMTDIRAVHVKDIATMLKATA